MDNSERETSESVRSWLDWKLPAIVVPLTEGTVVGLIACGRAFLLNQDVVEPESRRTERGREKGTCCIDQQVRKVMGTGTEGDVLMLLE